MNLTYNVRLAYIVRMARTSAKSLRLNIRVDQSTHKVLMRSVKREQTTITDIVTRLIHSLEREYDPGFDQRTASTVPRRTVP